MSTPKKYLECIPITNGNDARILGSSSSWEILELIRDKGTYGATAEEISNNLEIALSTVYNVLNDLRAAGFIEAKRFRKKLGKPSVAMQEEEKRTGKQKRIYVERINWGDFSQMTNEFRTYFADKIEDIIYDDDIIRNYCDLMDKIIVKMRADSDGKNLLPVGEICPKCHFNHEATEFVFALLYAIADTIKFSRDFEEICKKHEYLVYDI